jgi:hypothetical protein
MWKTALDHQIKAAAKKNITFPEFIIILQKQDFDFVFYSIGGMEIERLFQS